MWSKEPISAQEIARDMIARDRRMLERQKVAPKEKARRVLYRLFGIGVIVYLVGMAAAGAYVVVRGWWK